MKSYSYTVTVHISLYTTAYRMSFVYLTYRIAYRPVHSHGFKLGYMAFGRGFSFTLVGTVKKFFLMNFSFERRVRMFLGNQYPVHNGECLCDGWDSG